MIVVMPAGHVRGPNAGNPLGGAGNDPFVRDFVEDVMPIAIPHLDRFAYIGVHSLGLFGMFPTGRGGAAPAPAAGPSREQQHAATLSDANLKKGLRLFWFAIGTDDFLLDMTRQTVAPFKTHGFDPVYRKTDGGHTWLKWRDYLNEFAPQLFQ
jgi:enterochelin esterase-like enzyme